MTAIDRIDAGARRRPRASRASDVVVVGGGPAGFAAALAARAQGLLSVTLLERYPYLGGLASGGMVLVLDDMYNGARDHRARHLHGDDRAHGEASALAVYPAARRTAAPSRRCSANGRAGARSTSARSTKPQPDRLSPRPSIPTAGSASRTR